MFKSIAWIKGLGLGAGAMYFLDPREGPQRRAEFGGQLRDLAVQAGNAVDGHVRQLESQAHGMMGDLPERLGLPLGQPSEDSGEPAAGPADWSPATKVILGGAATVVALAALRRPSLLIPAAAAVGVSYLAHRGGLHPHGQETDDGHAKAEQDTQESVHHARAGNGRGKGHARSAQPGGGS